MRVTFFSSYSANLNQGLPLRSILDNTGLGFRRNFEIATFDYLYEFRGLRYKSAFSLLNQCGGKISSISIEAYFKRSVDKNDQDHGYENILNLGNINMKPNKFYNLLKKGDHAATKKLLQKSDSFHLNSNVKTSQIVNGYSGDDTFKIMGDPRSSARHELIGGKGKDFFEMNRSNDVITGGPQADTFYMKQHQHGSWPEITDFTKGKDRLIFDSIYLESPLFLSEYDGDSFIELNYVVDEEGDAATESVIRLNDTTDLVIEEQNIKLPGESKTNRFIVIS